MPREFKPYRFEPRHQPARLPPLRHGADTRRHPVVIVGAGQVGYCTAIGLAQHGIPAVLRPDGHVMARWCDADASRRVASVERTLRSLA